MQQKQISESLHWIYPY